MEGKRFLHSIKLRNLLSYGEEGQTLSLEPLNVLIGPNGSGKSNLIEAIGLLNSATTDLSPPIREGGGISAWIWKGPNQPFKAELASVVELPHGEYPLRYQLHLSPDGQKQRIELERIEFEAPGHIYSAEKHYLYDFSNGKGMINFREPPGGRWVPFFISDDSIKHNQSVLSQRKDPDLFPELTRLGEELSRIKIFRNWGPAASSESRKPQPIDSADDFLEENARNLALVLRDLEKRGVKPLLLDYMKKFNEFVEDITTEVHGDYIQFFMHEAGLGKPIPASRLSDGTLRYLFLIALLCHPAPPPLIGLEEPELGMHPDIIRTIARLLLEASQRTQLIVTTHSAELVSALSDTPEAVVVCEREEAGSYLTRLDPERLESWLDRYQLGDLWLMGEIGGTRW